VIVDIFPKSKAHLYCGDSTRVVVHGDPRPEAVAMHRAVVGAKHASEAAARAGVPVGTVNAASEAVLRRHGHARGFPGPGAPGTTITFQHGTGHGIGLDGHEPPLVDGAEGTGPALVKGDVVTLEPGLYSRALGGVRVEDMVVVRQGGCENLGRGLHEGMDWR
jgi:Xaa-Pro aminopeptidase